MSCVERLANGDYMALFHDDGRFISKNSKQQKPVQFHLYKTLSLDGGLTWGDPEVIAQHPQAASLRTRFDPFARRQTNRRLVTGEQPQVEFLCHFLR